jgi:hypothetical protein
MKPANGLWIRAIGMSGITASVNLWTTFTGVTDPPMVYGERSAYINRENIGINNTDEDWLITPAVTIGPDQWLSFYNRTTISGDQGTYFQVIGIDHIADGHREFCTGRGLDRG